MDQARRCLTRVNTGELMLYSKYMSNITFQVIRFSTFVFNKCSEIIIFTILFVVKSINKSLKGFGWNNVGPASQTFAQHHWANVSGWWPF